MNLFWLCRDAMLSGAEVRSLSYQKIAQAECKSKFIRILITERVIINNANDLEKLMFTSFF